MSAYTTSVQILNLSDMPRDPIKRLLWLSGVAEQSKSELDAAYQAAYFEARQTGRMNTALSLHLHSRKQAFAFTRHENERLGRQWHWNGN